jgi:tRNA uridine 5-carboxymethylaminomethyl modification enzyme
MVTEDLAAGFESGRMKTGTPQEWMDVRWLFEMNEEKGDAKPDKFSYSDVTYSLVHQKSCHMTYTLTWCSWYFEKVLIVRQCLRIKSLGPRYCPSIEDKINRFADKEKTPIICGARRMEYVWGVCKWIFNFASGRYSI